MLRFLAGLVSGGVLGTGLGFALGIFFYPFIFLADVVAQEQLSQAGAAERQLVASGTFIHVDPSDRVHWGKGGVELHQEADGSLVVLLGEDFEVGPGPAYRVYVKTAAEIASKSDFQDSPGVNIGALRAFKGSQVYEVPPEVAVDEIGSVVIWCERFSVLISPAMLNPS